MKIVVIGGSGLIGSKLVKVLLNQGHEPIAASRATGINSFSGEGLTEVLKGASVAIDVSNAPSRDDEDVMSFFETSTRNLLAHEAAAGVGQHVVLSVVGAERMRESGYIRAKIAQENMITASSIPYSIVRATQFYESVKSIADFATNGNKVSAPDVFFQPIAADDVAEALGKIVVEQPVNGTVEIGGPEIFRLGDAIRQILAAGQDSREVVSDPHGRYYDIAVMERTLVPESDAKLGAILFEDWLAQGNWK